MVRLIAAGCPEGWSALPPRRARAGSAPAHAGSTRLNRFSRADVGDDEASGAGTSVSRYVRQQQTATRWWRCTTSSSPRQNSAATRPAPSRGARTRPGRSPTRNSPSGPPTSTSQRQVSSTAANPLMTHLPASRLGTSGAAIAGRRRSPDPDREAAGGACGSARGSTGHDDAHEALRRRPGPPHPSDGRRRPARAVGPAVALAGERRPRRHAGAGGAGPADRGGRWGTWPASCATPGRPSGTCRSWATRCARRSTAPGGRRTRSPPRARRRSRRCSTWRSGSGVTVAGIPMLLVVLRLPPPAVAVRPRRRPPRSGSWTRTADLDLFALRAMAHQPMHRLAAVSDDPVRRGATATRPSYARWRCWSSGGGLTRHPRLPVRAWVTRRDE